jgi:hypothetical protein
MAETKTYIAVFNGIDPAAEAIAHLHEQGIGDDKIQVISGFPINYRVLGRPKPKSYVPWFALGGVVIGWGVATFLAAGITNLYPLKVGRQGLVNGGPTVVMVFEMMVLFMLVSTFIGVFLNSNLPSYKPMVYLPEISDGKIAIVYDVDEENEAKVKDTMAGLGASKVGLAERRQV